MWKSGRSLGRKIMIRIDYIKLFINKKDKPANKTKYITSVVISVLNDIGLSSESLYCDSG